MEDNLQKYLVGKGYSNPDDLFIKSAEIDALLAIIASDPSSADINSGLELVWGKVINSEVTDADRDFIRSKWGYYPFGLFRAVKKSGICGCDKEDTTNYLRRIWFFTFMAKNYKTVRRKDLDDIIDTAKKKEIDCGYFYEYGPSYIPIVLKKIYCTGNGITLPLRDKAWEYISKHYLSDLESIFEEAKETLLHSKKSTYENWFKIFTLIPHEDIPLVIPQKKQASATKAVSSSPAQPATEKQTAEPITDKVANTKADNSSQEPISPKENGAATVKESNSSEQGVTSVANATITNEPVEGKAADQSPKTEEAKEKTAEQKNDNEQVSSEVQSKSVEPSVSEIKEKPEEKVEEIHKLVLHTELKPRENVSQAFEESINTLFDLSQNISEVFKLEGIESLIKTLNSTAYGNLLDKVYFATQDKAKESSDFNSVAILLKNALQEYGFAFECYPKEPVGTCIGAPSDDDMEYISRNYRWKNDKILYHNLYVCAPGMMNRKTKTFVYPPLVEVK